MVTAAPGMTPPGMTEPRQEPTQLSTTMVGTPGYRLQTLAADGDFSVDNEPIWTLRRRGRRLAVSEISIPTSGAPRIRRFTLILDYRSQRMLLIPNVDFNEPFQVDLSGLLLVTDAYDFNVIRIKQVRANFPAAKIGLRTCVTSASA